LAFYAVLDSSSQKAFNFHMALRVLLADESSTIKRVIQLSLQDFAVEIKSVNLGIDVVEVAKKFQPDIVFADVLLQKRNGYEVTKEIKDCPELAHIPTVLMWSGFIDLDEEKYQDCGADERLEKPFDAEKLRSLVRKHVPKTSQQSLSKFLSYPKLDSPQAETPQNILKEHELELEEVPATPLPKDESEYAETRGTIPSPQNASHERTPQTQAPTKEFTEVTWNMDSFDDLPDLQEILPILEDLQLEAAPIPADLTSAPTQHALNPRSTAPTESSPTKDLFEVDANEVESSDESHDEDDAWAHKDLTQFKIDDSDDLVEPEVSYELDDAPVEEGDILHSTDDFSAKKLGATQSSVTEAPKKTGPSAISKIALGPSDNDGDIDHGPSTTHIPHITMGAFNNSDGEPVDISPLEFDDDPVDDGGTLHKKISLPSSQTPPSTDLTQEEIAAIVRAESRAIIETIARQVIPDLAERLIREELDRLLTEKEAQL
jgi:CheY-like chemotaxis protein